MTLPNTEWMKQGACRGLPTDWWFPEGSENHQIFWLKRRKAVQTCAVCPVKEECKEFGMTQEVGIWGGLDERDRRAIRKGQKVKLNKDPIPHPKCGTNEGYYYLRRLAKKNGVPLYQCPACKAGHSLAVMEYEKKKRWNSKPFPVAGRYGRAR